MDALEKAYNEFWSYLKNKRGKQKDDGEILQSIVALLNASHISSGMFDELAELLRNGLQPLYGIHLQCTFNFVYALFNFIYCQKYIPTRSKCVTSDSDLWEKTLSALLNGVLDHFESYSEKASSQLFAEALKERLCEVYFKDSVEKALPCRGDLQSIAYQILLYTSPAECAKLRDKMIKPKRLGLTIAGTHEFLALEALLDLLGSIIPPLSSGRANRAQFLRKVFDPQLFKASERILDCLKSIKHSDWSITATKIMHLLAESDLSFPQPFEVPIVEVDGVEMKSSAAFFVDKDNFVGNLHQEQGTETLYIPFRAIQKVKTTSTTVQNVQIVLIVDKPPTFGSQSMDLPFRLKHEIRFSVKSKQYYAFERSLKHRNLVIDSLKKVSRLPDGVLLDFDTENLKGDFQENKFKSVEKLWASARPPATRLTSPLASNRSYSEIQSDPPTAMDPVGGKQETVFLDHEDNMVFQLPGIMEKDKEDVNEESMEAEDDIVSWPKPGYTRLKRRIVVVSDDEDFDPDSKSRTTDSGPNVEQDTLVDEIPNQIASEVTAKGKNKRTGEESERHLTKKPRYGISTSGTLPPPLKRYGRKGRTSSPDPNEHPQINFDDIPPSRKDAPANSNGRARGMKGKEGKRNEKAKPKPKPKPKQMTRAAKRSQPIAVEMDTINQMNTIDQMDVTLVEPELKPEKSRLRGKSTADVSKTLKSALEGDEARAKGPLSKKSQKAPWEMSGFKKDIEGQKQHTVDNVFDAPSPSLDDPLPSVYDPEPVKVPDAPAKSKTLPELPTKREPPPNAELIDLTNSPEASTVRQPNAKKLEDVTTEFTAAKVPLKKEVVPVVRAATVFPVSSTLVLPEDTIQTSRGPLYARRHVEEEAQRDELRLPTSVKVLSVESPRRERVRDAPASTPKERYYKEEKFVKQNAGDRRATRDPNEKIASVLRQINEVVIHQVQNRFDGVAEELRRAQPALLAETASVLREMYDESVDHHNAMVELDVKYSGVSVKMARAMGEVERQALDRVQCVREIIGEQRRETVGMSKRMPRKLVEFSSKLSL